MKYNNENNDIFNQIQANILHIQNVRQMQSNNDKYLYINDFGNVVEIRNSRQKELTDAKYYSSGKFQVKSNAQEKQKDRSIDKKHKQQPSYPQYQREMTQRIRPELNNSNRGNRNHNTIEYYGSKTPTKNTAQIRKTPTHTPTRPRTPDYDKSDNQRFQRTPDGRVRLKRMNINTNEYEVNQYEKKSPFRKKENIATNHNYNNTGNQFGTNNFIKNNNTHMYTHSNQEMNNHLNTNSNLGNTNTHLYSNSNITAGNKSKRSTPKSNIQNKGNNHHKNKQIKNNNQIPNPSSMAMNKQQHLKQNQPQLQQQQINLELRKQHSQGRMYFPNNQKNTISNQLNNPQYENQLNKNHLSEKQITNNVYKNANTTYNMVNHYNRSNTNNPNNNNPVFESFGKPIGIPYPQSDTQRIQKQTNKIQHQQQPSKRNNSDDYQPSNTQKDLYAQNKQLSQNRNTTKKFQPNSYYKLPEEDPKIDFNELDQFSPPFTGQLNVNYNDPRMFSPVLTTNYTNIELAKDKHNTLNPSENHKLINDFISKINTNDKKYSTIEYQQMKYDKQRKTSSVTGGVPTKNYRQYKQI